MNYEEQIQKYKEYLKIRNFAETTIHHYTAGVKKFINYLLKERGIERIQEVSKEDLREYQNLIYNTKRVRDGKPVSVSRKELWLMPVKSFFKYLVKQGEVVYNIASDIDLPRRLRDIPKEIFKEREMEKILNQARGKTFLEIRDRAILEILYSTGIRNSELRNLKMKDIDLEKGEVFIEKGKGGKSRIVPLGRITSGYIEEYINTARPKLVGNNDINNLFVSRRGNKICIDWIPKIVRKYTQKAGIKKKANAHMIRHTCATHLLKGGADIRYVQELLGHECLSTTQLYTKIEISDLKRVHKKTHPRERLC